MSKEKTAGSENIFRMLNRFLPVVAVIVIGYILWASLYKSPDSPQDQTPVATTTLDQKPAPADVPAAENGQSPAVSLTPAAEDPQPPKSEQPKPEPEKKSSEAPEAVSEPPSSQTPEEEPKATKPKEELGPEPKFYNSDVANFLFENKCSECHKLTRVEKHTFADMNAVEPLIEQMIENGLEVNAKEKTFLVHFLQSKFVAQ